MSPARKAKRACFLTSCVCVGGFKYYHSTISYILTFKFFVYWCTSLEKSLSFHVEIYRFVYKMINSKVYMMV